MDLAKYGIHLEKRHKIILAAYILIGLPFIPLCFFAAWITTSADKKFFASDRRTDDVILICSMAVASTIFGVIIALLIWALPR
jgi:hypothetical protein